MPTKKSVGKTNAGITLRFSSIFTWMLLARRSSISFSFSPGISATRYRFLTAVPLSFGSSLVMSSSVSISPVSQVASPASRSMTRVTGSRILPSSIFLKKSSSVSSSVFGAELGPIRYIDMKASTMRRITSHERSAFCLGFAILHSIAQSRARVYAGMHTGVS